MPLKCFIRPNRSKIRHWNAKSAARAVCSALEHGAVRAEIEKNIELCDKARGKRDPTADEAYAEAELALSESNSLFSAQTDMLQRTLQVLGVLVAIGRFISLIPNPASRLVLVGSAALKAVAESQVKKIVVQKAANDSAIAALRRAAANEASFLQRVGL